MLFIKKETNFECVVQLHTELMRRGDAFTPSCGFALHGVIHIKRLAALRKTFKYF
jgi:hypothetical protein